MQAWKKVEARLTKVEVTERTSRYKGVHGQYYVPSVEFRFVVDGREYASDRFSVHNSTIGYKDDIIEALHGAKVGDSIEAFYDPKKPNRACLNRPGYVGARVALFIGFGLLALALWASLL